MLQKTILASAFFVSFSGVVIAADNVDNRGVFNPNVNELNPASEPPMLGVHWTKDMHAAKVHLARVAANMTYHKGKIMPTATTMAFFRGTSWATYSGDKITGIDDWYNGFSGSNYAATVKEYTGTNGSAASSPTAHQGHFIDSAAETSKGSTSAVLAEVCAGITASGAIIDPNGNGYYPLYSDQKRGSAGYCAWHSAGTCNGKAIQYAFFWNLDGDAGCDPADTSGLHSQGLAALASVMGHELAEAMSDPASPGAWYDAAGAENGDKCAWTFGAPLVTLSNGTKWKIQGEWSNKAFTAGTGYANSSGQKGCISGL